MRAIPCCGSFELSTRGSPCKGFARANGAIFQGTNCSKSSSVTEFRTRYRGARPSLPYTAVAVRRDHPQTLNLDFRPSDFKPSDEIGYLIRTTKRKLHRSGRRVSNESRHRGHATASEPRRTVRRVSNESRHRGHATASEPRRTVRRVSNESRHRGHATQSEPRRTARNPIADRRRHPVPINRENRRLCAHAKGVSGLNVGSGR